MYTRALWVMVLMMLVSAPTAAATTTADVEVDPTAFALDGYSLHAGVHSGAIRVDLGAYAMRLPAAFAGQDQLDVAFHGFGVKAQRFFGGGATGGFAGVGLGLNDTLVRHRACGEAAALRNLGAGVHAGWRFGLPQDFYVTPWLGLDYTFGPRRVALGGETYAPPPWSVFPAVHLGYRFP